MAMRQWLKQHTPTALHRLVRRIEALLRRIGIWLRILLQLRGVQSSDTRVLWRSFFAGLAVAARDLDEWRDPVLVGDAWLEVSGVGRFHARAFSDDLWHALPSREQAITDTVNNLLAVGDCFVDAGANIGFYSVLAARRVGPTGQVVAFEMMPDTAALLREHLQVNACEQAQVIENALSDQVGATVEAQVTVGKFGQASIAAAASAGADSRAIQVQTTTLDSALEDLAEIRLIKLDLEGAELLAVRGGSAVLARTESLIYECWVDDPVLDGLLREYGFSVSKLDGRNNLATR